MMDKKLSHGKNEHKTREPVRPALVMIGRGQLEHQN